MHSINHLTCRRSLALLGLWLLWLGSGLSAQPVLLKDINTAPPDQGGWLYANPGPLFTLNGAVYYMGQDSLTGLELWKTDGTTAGTGLVRDMYPGPFRSYPSLFTRLNNTVYFLEGRTRLWKTDGTTGGTVLVRDVLPEVAQSFIFSLAVLNNTLYFLRDDGSNGFELWKSNGTAAGTTLVKKATPGSASVTVYQPLVNVGNRLYFVANNGTNGTELFRSDGTAAGTVMVKDINPGENGSFPENLTNFNGTLYFTANNGTSGQELFRSDGTAAGTVLVKDIYPGARDEFGTPYPNNGGAGFLTNFNGTLYFTATDGVHGNELWQSNGTAAGTTLVKDINPGSGSSTPQQLVNFNGALYLIADNGVHGRELWKSNGTAAGTTLIKDIQPGALSGFESYNTVLAPVNGTLYFTATDGVTGREPWKSDGTAAGTTLIKDIYPGGRSSQESTYRLPNLGGTVFFMATDGTHGEELWKTDGTAAGTVMLRNTTPPDGRYTNDSWPADLTPVNGTLYFTATDGVHGRELWKSNGTPGTTVLVKDIVAGAGSSYPAGLTNLNGTLYFGASGGLWKSNGTAAGTTLVKNVAAGSLLNLNGTIYFSSNTALWKSDGTPAGTVLVKDGMSPGNLTQVNGTLYFVGNDGTHGEELWKSNGTAAGTVMVKDIRPTASGAGPFFLTNVSGTLFFSANDETNGREFWKSDGTATGTVMVRDLFPGSTSNRFGDEFPNSSGPENLTNVNGTLYFTTSSDFEGGRILWKCNAAGTSLVQLKYVPSYPGNPYLADLFNYNGTLCFVASDPEAGKELWKTDGTEAGTVRVKDLFPGWQGSEPYGFAVSGNRLYFVANDGLRGKELWRTDGTSAGTVLIKDIVLGALGEDSPFAFVQVQLTDVNGTLYFVANDGYGQELWKYNAAGCTEPNAALAVAGSTVCANQPGTVTVKASQAGVTYGVYFGLSPVGQPRTSTGGDLVLSIPTVSLGAGANPFTVKAQGCVETTLTMPVTVTVQPALVAPTAAGKTISSGQTATLTATGAPAGAAYRWYAAATGGTPLATTATYTTPALVATTTYFVAAYLPNCGESPRASATVSVTPTASATLFRVNAGGNAFTTGDARGFAADAYFSGGAVSAATALGIGGTGDDYLYQTGRHGSSFSYNFPTGNGSYDVVLHFAETYFGNTVPGGAGSRKFHVNLEGARKLTDYDVFARAGGALKVAQETFRVTVSDGTLNVAFLKGAADNPAVKAIEVLPAGAALTINAGGNAYTTAGGKRFSADSYYAAGTVSAAVTGDIVNTYDDPLYQTGRHGASFSYGLPTGNGTFKVTLHFAETYWGNKVGGGVGARKFNVDAEGVRKLTEYDIFARAGGALRAVTETFTVTVSDGVLNLLFSKGSADVASLRALEVVPATAAAREDSAGLAAPETASAVKLFPNPAREQLFVELPVAADQVQGTAVTDASGHVLLQDQHRVHGERRLLIPVGGLPAGLYLLRLRTANGVRVVRFVKQ
jgi:ELWxxDGT repeat protein